MSQPVLFGRRPALSSSRLRSKHQGTTCQPFSDPRRAPLKAPAPSCLGSVEIPPAAAVRPRPRRALPSPAHSQGLTRVRLRSTILPDASPPPFVPSIIRFFFFFNPSLFVSPPPPLNAASVSSPLPFILFQSSFAYPEVCD